MNNEILNQLNLIPHKPGVYIIKNKDEDIIYIGKAKNLYLRVSQYFLKPQIGKVRAMVEHADSFSYIVTFNEKEALILEMNLIQEHHPRYNILLKDDKHYPYIGLSKTKDPFLKVLRKKDDRYICFGPYPNSTYAYDVVDLLNNIFPLRKCKVLAKKPCLYYSLEMCMAPCINEISDDAYKKYVEKIKDFFNGNNDDIKKDLLKKVNMYSEKQQYENAKEQFELIKAIDSVISSQRVEDNQKIDRDYIAISTKEGYLSIGMLMFRNAILLDKKVFVVPLYEDINLQTISLLEKFYLNKHMPKVLYGNIDGLNKLEEFFPFKVLSPKKGRHLDLINMCETNAKEELNRYFTTAKLDEDNLSLLDELAKLLNIKLPLDIELYDNSHIQGTSPIGVMVKFINGDKATSKYRKFNIQSANSKDDLDMMKEVVGRRFKRLKEEKEKLPDLILLDGGKNQLQSVKEILANLDVDVPLFGLYKNNKHQTEGIMDVDGNTYLIEKKSPLFFLLIRMQDEVHRYAIAFHRSLRNKKSTRSFLDDIKGLGAKRKALLLETYTDLNELKKATLEQLNQILPKEVALDVFQSLKNMKM